MSLEHNSYNYKTHFSGQPLAYKLAWLGFVLFLVFSINSLYAQTNGCHSSLVHHFGLEEKISGTYVDYKSNAVATCTSCPAPVTGIYGGAQSFDGVKNGLVLNEFNAFEWGPNSNFTLELWMKSTAKPSDNQIMIGRRAEEHNMIWWLGMDKAGQAVFALWDNTGKGANIVSTQKINDGKWHHIAVVRDGRTSRTKLYVDGFATANFEISYSGYFDKSTAPVTIGHYKWGSGYHFKGELDEIMLFKDYALTEVEARARYNNGNGNYCGTQQAKPVIMSTPVTYGTVGQDYRYDVQATGAPVPTFSIASGPAGLTIQATTGEITWKPTVTGTYDVTVKAGNNVGEDQQHFKIVIKKSISEQAGLLHHWMLHELSGSDYYDYYTPFHARSVGTSRPEPIAGVVSGGQHFDGKEDALDVAGSKNFDWQPTSSFTIELWMRSGVKKSANRVLIGRQARDSPVHWWLGITETGKARFVLFDLEFKGITQGVGDAGPRLDDGVWHQVVAVRDGTNGTTKVYVDGEVAASGSFKHTVGFESISEINIGYLSGQDPTFNGYRYEGDLDEVKLFGRPLSADEIRQNYHDVFNAMLELVKFEGVYRNETVVLDWATKNEVNTESFTVERSLNTQNFEAIGEVKGAGNTSQTLAYTFTDKNPLKEDTYYRLKINRKDGTFTYSKIILVRIGRLNATTFRLYPNPLHQSGQEVTVVLESLVPDEEILFYISDLTGKRLRDDKFTVDADGRLSFTIPATLTDQLQPGLYMFTVITKLKRISRKLMVEQ
jgi:hypothetical protein